jgi:hypothetical protein
LSQWDDVPLCERKALTVRALDFIPGSAAFRAGGIRSCLGKPFEFGMATRSALHTLPISRCRIAVALCAVTARPPLE